MNTSYLDGMQVTMKAGNSNTGVPMRERGLGVALCPLCGKAMNCRGTEATLVGYISPAGHNHDDNCRFRDYTCEGCGHRESVSKRNRCPVCDWVGKERCFCHSGLKMDKWPEEGI